jgi:hypothetical protein
MEPTVNKSVIVQKLKKAEGDAFDVAQRYYTIISAINDLKLTERELQLTAFTAVKGNILIIGKSSVRSIRVQLLRLII